MNVNSRHLVGAIATIDQNIVEGQSVRTVMGTKSELLKSVDNQKFDFEERGNLIPELLRYRPSNIESSTINLQK